VQVLFNEEDIMVKSFLFWGGYGGERTSSNIFSFEFSLLFLDFT
jgi:hypothetical protein